MKSLHGAERRVGTRFDWDRVFGRGGLVWDAVLEMVLCLGQGFGAIGFGLGEVLGGQVWLGTGY